MKINNFLISDFRIILTSFQIQVIVEYSVIKSFTPESDFFLFLNKKLDENKERVPFYMSLLTTMKFIVRGKSVDFRNREGSSPSIPKKTI